MEPEIATWQRITRATCAARVIYAALAAGVIQEVKP